MQRVVRFCKATGLDKQSGENQVNTLIYMMGEQADDILILFELTTEEETNYEEVKEKFENHFIVTRNVIFEQVQFQVQFKKPVRGRIAGYFHHRPTCMVSQGTAILER